MMYTGGMRTTVDLDDDVAAAIDQLRRGGSVGLSEAVNQLIRAGLLQAPRAHRFRQRSAPLGLRIDVSNVAEALEILDGAGGR
jgi:metal-responsive CopG/Arc/MetJ family transcriptional regulator